MALHLRAGFVAVWVAGGVALAAGCAPNVLVDRAGTTGGGAAGQGGGTSSSTTSSATGTGGGTTTSTSTIPPDACPGAPPQPGSHCEGAATCNYGGGDCPAVFACVGGQWAQAGDCAQPACPPGEPTSGTPCPKDGMVCNYDMQCSGAQATCQNGTWSVEEYGVGCAAMCPEKVPDPGSYCDVCCLPPECDYPVQGCAPTIAHCKDDGTWDVWPGDCQPPPLPLCEFHDKQGECESDPDCRWLVPGCGEPALPQAGCFSKQDCVTDADCGPQHCTPAVFDPCWDKGCNACAGKAMVCLP